VGKGMRRGFVFLEARVRLKDTQGPEPGKDRHDVL